VEHEVVPILGGRYHVVCNVFGEERRPEVKARDSIEDGVICGGYLEGGDVDGAGDKKLLVEGWRGFVVGEKSPGVVCRIRLEDDVMEWACSKPGGIYFPLTVWLGE
jgi:hypothetical protein